MTRRSKNFARTTAHLESSRKESRRRKKIFWIFLDIPPPSIDKSDKAGKINFLRSEIKPDAQIFATYKKTYLQISENYDVQKNKAVRAALFCLALLIFAFGIAILILKARLHQKSAVSKRITQILENERRRISRDLHDSVIQEIRSIKLESDRIGNGKISENTINELRSICYNLTPPDLNLESGATLEILLAGLCSEFQKKNKIKCIFVADENLPEIKSKDKMLTIFRIVQESLQNISEHSNAQNCSVVVRNRDGIVIFITDDGNGFDLALEMKKPFCFGLKTMFERASQIGAILSIESAAGDGTEIKLEIKK